MHVLGIVGGIASGKSTVAAELAALGAVVLNADRAAHEAINRPEVKQTLVKRWGEAILDPSGEALRQAIANALHEASSRSNGQEALASGGDEKAGRAMAASTVANFEKFKPEQVVMWCPSCIYFYDDIMEMREEFSFQHVTEFLLKNLDKLDFKPQPEAKV
ncbi:MAG: dephospho-CoA kinase, partial [Planctomycetes bacterium]|nr:dephospho-CoA kinase [Planctomycetota bacterium]